MRIGIDLGGTKTEAIALDENGAELTRRRIASPRGDYAATITSIRDLVAAIESETDRTGTVGIGMPGAISPATGLVKNANSTWLIGHPFTSDIEAALARPVRIANDADCFTLSEAVDGAGRGARVVFGVILGTGVGGGISVSGQLLSGPNAIVGEWGHNPMPWMLPDEYPGPPCYCGKKGCIETWISGPAFAADYNAAVKAVTEGAPPPPLTAEEIVAAANEGQRPARLALRRYSDRLARALSHLINILDPDVIVLGGGMSSVDALYDEIPSRWGSYVFSDSVATRLTRPHHGPTSGVRGAAWLWQG